MWQYHKYGNEEEQMFRLFTISRMMMRSQRGGVEAALLIVGIIIMISYMIEHANDASNWQQASSQTVECTSNLEQSPMVNQSSSWEEEPLPGAFIGSDDCKIQEMNNPEFEPLYYRWFDGRKPRKLHLLGKSRQAVRLYKNPNLGLPFTRSVEIQLDDHGRRDVEIDCGSKKDPFPVKIL